MNTKIGIGLLLIGIMQAALAFEAVEINPLAYFANIGPTPPGTGFAFETSTNIVITSLGYDLNGNSSVTGRVVLVNSAGVVLRSANVSTNSTLVAGTYYESILPVTIPAGETNYLVVFGHYSTSSDAITLSATTDGFTMGPGLQFLAGVGTDQESNPAQYQFPMFLKGANFQYVLQPPPPPLQMSLTSTNTILLSWPTQVVNCVLQSTGDSGGSMTNVAQPPVVVGTNCTVLMPADGSMQLFRLSN